MQQSPDDLHFWIEAYLQADIEGIRSVDTLNKINLHLRRFSAFFEEIYGHRRITVVVKRDVQAWQKNLQSFGFAFATINNHLASLSGFTSWITSHHPRLFARGNPTKGIRSLPLPPLEPRSLNKLQVQSLKNICDRLPNFHTLKGRKWRKKEVAKMSVKARPYRDRAIVFLLLSTGLRREELVHLDFDPAQYGNPEKLRKSQRVRLAVVHGKGGTSRIVFLSKDAREALADYLEKEHSQDRRESVRIPLFLSAKTVGSAQSDGRLTPRSINHILEQIGRWHDAEFTDPERHISPLRPHDLRHTFAFQLAETTGADSFELERRLGHQSARYIQRYTNPPEEVAASYIEEF